MLSFRIKLAGSLVKEKRRLGGSRSGSSDSSSISSSFEIIDGVMLSGGVGGGVEPGKYSRIEHQLRRGRRWTLFRFLRSTSCVNIGIMSSSVYLSIVCTLLRLFNTSAMISGGGVLTMADEMTLGM